MDTSTANILRDTLADMRKLALEKTEVCFARDSTCSKSIQRCHLLGESAQLMQILGFGGAENNELKIIYPSSHGVFFNEKVDWKAVPSSRALTFKGFCNTHDNILFRDIDKPIKEFTQETTLQLSKRAASYRLWQHLADSNAEFLWSDNFGKVIPAFDIIASPPRQYQHPYWFKQFGVVNRKTEMEYVAKSLADRLSDLKSDGVLSKIWYFKQKVPFVFSFAFDAGINWFNDLQANPVSGYQIPIKPYLYAHLLNLEAGSALVFSWTKDLCKVSKKMISDFDKVQEEDRLLTLLSFSVVNNMGLVASSEFIAGIESSFASYLLDNVGKSTYGRSEEHFKTDMLAVKSARASGFSLEIRGEDYIP